MRILVDYRPALRERTGVGEVMHNLVRAYADHPACKGDEISIFTSSWRDRPSAADTAELGARVIDRRVPVRLLNYCWHRLEWPPAEMLAGTFDVVHAAHPLLIPSRLAAQVVTIHDLFFMSEPERALGEIRRDYPRLAPRHARRADAIVTPSRYTADLVIRTFGVAANRVHICPWGPPAWRTLGHRPNLPPNGYVLFVGTLEPRKNVGVLLDAYARLLHRSPNVVPLVLAGRATADASLWLDRLSSAPLVGHVQHLGYVTASDREQLYAGARLLVLPSREEGFGLPVLEAMSAGVPVIASTRGSLPEVIGAAGVLVDPDDVQGLAAAMSRILEDEAFARERAVVGLARAQEFSWDRAAASLRSIYESAIANRRKRGMRIEELPD